MMIMGIVNATPDSFSDGGEGMEPDAAASKARRLVNAGAEIIDIGAESTRPGADEIDAAEEGRRLFPVLEAVLATVSVPISIDTRHAAIAHKALAMGARIINDVSALEDPKMAATTADANAELVVMHGYREHRATPEIDPERMLVTTEAVAEFLLGRIADAEKAGVPRSHIIADPGLGFGKSHRESLSLLECADELKKRLGTRVLIAPSRKRFLRLMMQRDAAPFDRDEASFEAMRRAAAAGADIVRMHALPKNLGIPL